MDSDLKVWMEQTGEMTLRNIGITSGQTLLDFGCGSGNYVIPAARIVGDDGVVYALDKNQHALDALMERAHAAGLTNIHRMDTSGEITIRLPDERVDVVLLYDIFWYIPVSDYRLQAVLLEVHRVAKPDALLSVYPTHTDPDQLRSTIEHLGFQFTGTYSGTFYHYRWLEQGQVLNFKKH
jgi:ubiquinone/menaquinone biosynthesis C-methylase UbiE